MKQLLLLVFAAFCTFQISATVITVSNNPVDDNAAQYASLQDAFDAATEGDTVLVSGSSASYGNATLTKQIVLIGAGYNPDNQTHFKSIIGSLTMQVGMDGFGNPVSNPSGSKIMGFEISYIYGYEDVDDVVLMRNKIYAIYLYYGSSEWDIINNIVDIVYDNNRNASNIVISNNVIINYVGRFQEPTVLVTNNLFIKSSGYSFSQISNAVITNNIFYGAETSGCDYCIFNNNISIGAGYTEFIYANNTGGNNQVGANPLFVSVASTAFSYSDDYHLQGSSPGIDAGSDGSDIGIYGGLYPFPSGGDVPYQTSAMPNIPQIIEMNVQNSVLPQNETLQVQVQANTQE